MPAAKPELRKDLIANVSADKRRPFVIAGALLGCVLIAALGWWLLRPPEVAVVQIEPGAVEITLSVVGRVRPENLLDIRSPNSGQITALFHDDGDVVDKGEALATIRSVIEQAQTDAGSARERAARAEVTRAELVFNRTRTLADRGVASQAALDEARAVLQAAQAGLDVAKSERLAASARSGEFTIRAPMPGVVLVRPVDDGQVVSPETTLFQLGSLGGVELQADVDEAYGDALRPGMSARAALSGSDAIFPARLSEVSPRVDPSTGGRLIKLVPVDQMTVPLGRSVDITIVVERREGAITLPREAVMDGTTQPSVLVVDQGGTVQLRAINIADWPSQSAIVESGLASGDRVVLAPGETSPSAKVRARTVAAPCSAGRLAPCSP